MPILLKVCVAANTAKKLAAIELSHLAGVTGCMIQADFEELHLIVSPGQDADFVEKSIDQHRAQVQAWRQHQEQKNGPKA